MGSLALHHACKQTGKKNPVCESITYWENIIIIIRVWNDEKEWTFGPNKEIVKALEDIVYNPPLSTNTESTDIDSIPTYKLEPQYIATKLCTQFPTISAIEILDYRTKCGGIYYPDCK